MYAYRNLQQHKRWIHGLRDHSWDAECSAHTSASLHVTSVLAFALVIHLMSWELPDMRLTNSESE